MKHELRSTGRRSRRPHPPSGNHLSFHPIPAKDVERLKTATVDFWIDFAFKRQYGVIRTYHLCVLDFLGWSKLSGRSEPKTRDRRNQLSKFSEYYELNGYYFSSPKITYSEPGSLLFSKNPC